MSAMVCLSPDCLHSDVIARAWKAGNKDASIILFGVLASFSIHLVGKSDKTAASFIFNISFPYLVEIGVLLFLLFQVYLLANHYALAYKNLEMINLDLETKVQARTAELTKANQVREKLLSVVSHDIKGPLNSLRGVLDIYQKGGFFRIRNEIAHRKNRREHERHLDADG